MLRNPTAERTWFEFVAALPNAPAEIFIYDYIGSYGVTAADFNQELKALGQVDKATLYINSPGGETPTAASIYNMLERWVETNGVTLTVVVDGIAASSASWIAMLGAEIIMPENTLMMIHDPSGGVFGTSRDMKSMSAVLDRIKQGMAKAYAKKSGQDIDAINEIMTAETWYSAEEAVEAGFADRVDNPIQIAASYDLSRFKNPPEASGGARDRNVASKETNMVTKPNETPAEMEARLRAEITASLTPATPVVVPPTAAVVETPAEIEARVRASITAANAEVTSLCAIAGKPELAATFLAQGKTATEVRVALEAAAKVAPQGQQPQAGVNTHGGQLDLAKDVEAKFTATSIVAADVYANLNKGGKGTPVKYAA